MDFLNYNFEEQKKEFINIYQSENNILESIDKEIEKYESFFKNNFSILNKFYNIILNYINSTLEYKKNLGIIIDDLTKIINNKMHSKTNENIILFFGIFLNFFEFKNNVINNEINFLLNTLYSPNNKKLEDFVIKNNTILGNILQSKNEFLDLFKKLQKSHENYLENMKLAEESIMKNQIKKDINQNIHKKNSDINNSKNSFREYETYLQLINIYKDKYNYVIDKSFKDLKINKQILYNNLVDIIEKFNIYIENNSKEHFYNQAKKENFEKIIKLLKNNELKNNMENKDDNNNNNNEKIIIKTENINNNNEKEKINNQKIVENNNDNLTNNETMTKISNNSDNNTIPSKCIKNNYLHEIHFQEYKLQSMLYFNKFICRQHYLLKQMKPEDILIVITQMKEEFPEITKEIDIKKEQYKIEIFEYINNLFENKEINLEFEKHFFKFLKENDEYIIFFLSILNVNRTNNKYKLNKNSFEKFIEIFNFILDKEYNKNNKNIEIFNFIIIMSQTYCFEDESNNNEKIFIQKNIKNHKIFKEIINWENSLFYQIDEEIVTSNKINIGLNIEELQQRYENIVFSKLLSLIHNLIEFDIDKNVINEFINKVKNKYKDVDINKNMNIINNLINIDNKK